MRKSRLAFAAGAAAVAFLWWAATSRKPAPDARTLLVERTETAPRAPRVEPEPPAPAPETPPAELTPPEPVLTQSAQRRFSSPASQAAAGGIAGAEAAEGPPAAGLGGGVNLPGGYDAPTASVGRFAPPPGPRETAAAPGVSPAPGAGPDASPETREAADRRAAAEEDDGPSAAQAPGDRKVTGAAAGLVTAARDLKSRGDAAAMRENASLEKGLMRQIEADGKMDAGIRKAISDIQSSGRPVTMEEVTEAAEEVLQANGLTHDDVDLPTAIARASAPPPPEVPRAAYLDAVRAIVSVPALDPEQKVEIQRLADKPPPPRAPAPRGALDAYRRHKDVLDKAHKDFGVKPEHILGILGVETGWGRNTGKYPLPATLKAISERTGPDGRPTKQARQAGRDLAALARLSAQGNLGGLSPGQVRGSYAGAMGIPQFLPTSWEALSRSPDGGKRDPFEFGDAAYSVGNYLRAHGYSKNVAGSIWGYNHSQEYVDKVLGLSASVKASLPSAPSK
ncbi:MAG: lytic murein transglycosylase [Elusimicrobia bacterium]|nr:lytic murein transglycosylase [Elusimicrobiota bacterium]